MSQDDCTPTNLDTIAVDWPVEDWRYDVANGDTKLGYEAWVQHNIESAQLEASPCEGCEGHGIRLNQHGLIERCDTCEKYASDDEAWLAANPANKSEE